MFSRRINPDAELRLLETCHARDVFALVRVNANYLREWLPWVDTTRQLADTEEYLRLVLEQYADNRALHCGIWYKAQLAGILGLSFNWNHRQATIGYWLGQPYQGRGLMTSACRTVIDDCFIARGINRVEIRCATGNTRSQAIPQRLGFAHEGVIRDAEWLYDHYVNHIIYGMLARDWLPVAE